ncbi:MAG: amidohydrolase [Gammaproteobacteria bacterium]|jgi:predicted amidohydrolase YtcJ|nr:amidohydrolase [Gammaproteobacteria bacterium]
MVLHFRFCAIIVFASLGIFFSMMSQAQDTASTIVYTAREVVTLNPAQPLVQAVAVREDSIVATGSLEEIQQTLSGETYSVDSRFEDLVLIPGLINQHEHAWLASLLFITEILSIEDWVLPDRTIERAKDAANYRERLTKIVAEHTDPSEVIYTWGFHQLFHGELTRSDLDEISDTIPIVVLQRSIHEQIHNTRALEYFGIDQTLIDNAPASVRAQTNLEEGHFWEQGQSLIVPAVFADLFHPSRYIPALEQVEAYWHSAGSTLVAEPGGSASAAFIEMQNQVLSDSDTPFRMHYIVDGRSFVANLPEAEVITEVEKLFITAQGMTEFIPKQVKLFADGAMFSQLMQMSEGYLDGHHGEWLMDPEDFANAFRIYWDAGYQIHVHQNGDAGLDLVLDNLQANMARNPRADHRTVIVHFGFSRPDQVDTLANLGAIVSANPFYPIILADKYSNVGIGPERAQEMVRLGDLVRADISFSLHSDTPMASGQPLRLMSNAVNRITVNGNLVGPTQRISAERALRSVTIDAAYSLRKESEVGSIVPGKLANFTVLTENPLTVSPQSIESIEIWGTVHEGRVLPIP